MMLCVFRKIDRLPNFVHFSLVSTLGDLRQNKDISYYDSIVESSLENINVLNLELCQTISSKNDTPSGMKFLSARRGYLV